MQTSEAALPACVPACPEGQVAVPRGSVNAEPLEVASQEDPAGGTSVLPPVTPCWEAGHSACGH
eukprot:3049966-Heterocapsa_arctica.AAC.1